MHTQSVFSPKANFYEVHPRIAVNEVNYRLVWVKYFDKNEYFSNLY